MNALFQNCFIVFPYISLADTYVSPHKLLIYAFTIGADDNSDNKAYDVPINSVKPPVSCDAEFVGFVYNIHDFGAPLYPCDILRFYPVV